MKSHPKLLLRLLGAVLMALFVLVGPQVLRAGSWFFGDLLHTRGSRHVRGSCRRHAAVSAEHFRF